MLAVRKLGITNQESVISRQMKIPGLGIATSTATVTLPEGAANPKLSSDGQRLT